MADPTPKPDSTPKPFGDRPSRRPGKEPPKEPTKEPDRVSRGLVALAAVVVLVVAVVIASAFIPRWWAHRVGAQVDGSMTRGIIFGLFYGFVFVLLPLAILRWTFRKRRGWKFIALASLVALVLASPNLTTLAIVFGSGNAAHAGERTLDVQAPGFRYASLAGALAAGALWLWFEWLQVARWRERRHAQKLRQTLDDSRKPVPSPPAVENDARPSTPPSENS
jgi:MFS family permease